MYDAINVRLYKPGWLAKVRSLLRGRVLDVGVGTGFTTGHLEDAVGIDLSRAMLRRARVRGHLVQADFLRPPFRGESFDTVVFAGSFYYLEDPVGGLRLAAGLLRPGGRVVLLSPASLVFAAFVPVYDKASYARSFEAAGLRMEGYERLNWAACLVTASKA